MKGGLKDKDFRIIGTKMQRDAVKGVLKGLSPKEALVKAGYSEKTNSQVFKSETFQELFRHVLPDYALASKHKELLNKEKILYNKTKEGAFEAFNTGEIDTDAVAKALDMAYKIIGVYAPIKAVNLNLTPETLPSEYDHIVKEAEDRIVGLAMSKQKPNPRNSHD